jgi:4-hydroxy-tetrahydrodipicolinate synthase
MITDINGVISPALTPIADDGTVALDRVHESVEWTIQCGCDILVAAGTGVQEIHSLTPEERKQVMEETVKAVNERVPVIAGVTHPSQNTVQELIHHAESLGADAVLAMPPWSPGLSEATIDSYFTNIIETSSLPVGIYHNPGFSRELSNQKLRELCQQEEVQFLKDSSGSWEKIAWLIENIENEGDANVFTTKDELLPAIQTGGSGGISPGPSCAILARIMDSFESGNIQEATDYQRIFARFPPEEVTVSMLSTYKKAAQLRGVEVGPRRPPFNETVSSSGEKAIEQWLDKVNIPKLSK